MRGGTLVCARDITAKAIYDAIADEGVTHFGGAPIVLNTVVNRCKMGSMKAAVLPVPFWASPNMSLPARTTGMPCS